jgi:N-acetylglucosaminyl-diphospho-decaprenol L-rhamnosyltransferase
VDRFVVVVVNYNTREDLQACLETVLATDAREVIVADNGSTDGSREMVREDFADTRLLCFDDNPGYGGAANRAVATTDTPFVLLLNSDTLLAPDTLAMLGDYLDRHPAVGIIGPRLLNPDGTLQPSCYPYPGSLRWALDNDDLAPLLRHIKLAREAAFRTWDHDRAREVPWVKGAAMAIRRTAFEEVGGFDDAFFMYHEETDLCFRMARAGWKTHFAPVTDIIHTGESSTSQYRRAMSRALDESTRRFHRKHYSGPRKLLASGSWSVLTMLRRALTRRRAHQ